MRINRLAFLVLLSLGTLLALVTLPAAQTVLVRSDLGQNGYGWMFREGQTCYVALPSHVAGPLPQITLTSEAPVVIGTASVLRPFWPGIDLAVGVVRGGIRDRCTASLDALETTSTARQAGQLRLRRISDTGAAEWTQLDVIESSYLTIEAEITVDQRDVFGGTSGALAFFGDRPVGMAYEAPDNSRIRLMRSDEMVIHLRRYLIEEGVAFAATAAPTPIEQPAGVAVTIDRVSQPPISTEFGADNVLGNGIYVFEPVRGAEIVLRIEADTPISLHGIRIEAPPEAGYAVPRDILIMTDAGATGDAFGVWIRARIPADGVYDSGPVAGRNARWIKIVFGSAHAPGPVTIGRIVLK